jgi:hypothetical protein
MSNWLIWDRKLCAYVALADAAPAMTELVEHNMGLSDFEYGDPDPDRGYSVVVKGSEIPSEYGVPESINISLTVGAKWKGNVEFSMGDILSEPDPALITYSMYRGALEALAQAWPCPWALAYTWTPDHAPVEEWDGVSPIWEVKPRTQEDFRRPFEVAWIGYLSAPLAKGLTPSPEIVWERTPGGGMILSAVRETIDQSNPEHMRRAAILEAIMNERVGVKGWAPIQHIEHPARVGPY